ncbi:MAG: transaldolase [Actinobacteria bacterium]|nr:transaldolase [Actinomycetota bacterium]
MTRLRGLTAAGVSVWSDQISRRMLDSGELAMRVERDVVSGVTSNPTIFAGAIVGSDDYRDQLDDLRRAGVPAEEIVKTLMATDLTRACDVLSPVHEASRGSDGFVSVEVSPVLAADTEATIAEARDWTKQINRPNLLVKVPATPQGIPAIRRLTAEGISVNVTLIFSLRRYDEVMEAYIAGVEDFAASGGDPSLVFSVASFFVSRVDTEVDRRLAAIATAGAEQLMGRAAIANARVAYGLYLDKFASGRFTGLAEMGARPQKPLWASTSTKNPAYHDLMYVEGLVAEGTVNTMPLETIDAYQDHGDPEPTAFTTEDIETARTDLDSLARVGIVYDDVVDTLEKEGVEKFAASWRQLVESIR